MNDADRLTELLLDQGFSLLATLKPLDALESLLADREDTDWWNAFMAALAGGSDAGDSEIHADLAVAVIKRRRHDRLNGRKS